MKSIRKLLKVKQLNSKYANKNFKGWCNKKQ